MGMAGMIAATVILFVLIVWMLILALWNDYAARMTDQTIGFKDQQSDWNEFEQSGPENPIPSGTSDAKASGVPDSRGL